MRLRSEAGFSLLLFAVILSVILVSIMFFTMGRSGDVSKRMGQNLSLSYANDIAIKLAQKVRYAYDIAKVTEDPSANQPTLCSSLGGAIEAITPSVHLCLKGKQVCVDHPRTGAPICVSKSTKTLAHRNSPMFDVFLPRALAQASDAPATPLASDTANVLAAAPVTCAGGSLCGATCSSANADCVTYGFCPLVGSCTTDQMVWQTIALLK